MSRRVLIVFNPLASFAGGFMGWAVPSLISGERPVHLVLVKSLLVGACVVAGLIAILYCIACVHGLINRISNKAN